MHKVLIIDDEKRIVDILTTFLKEKGFNVTAACGGQEGLDIIKKSRGINLILLDDKMPGIDGAKVVERLKDLRKKIPIIVLTSSFGASHVNKFLDIHYKNLRELLYKPIRLSELLDVINENLPKSK